MRKIINFLIKGSLYSLIFLMPLFWLPFTIEAHEFNKQYLLVFLVSIAFIAWLAKLAIVRKKLFFRRTALDLWVLGFMLIMILSAIFSIDSISSWFGFYGRFSGSVIGVLALIMLYFIVVNNVKTASKDSKTIWGLSLEGIYKLFLTSSWIVVIVSYISVFNLWIKIPKLPEIMTFRSFNPISGSLEGLAIFLAMAISLVVGLVLSQQKIKNVSNVSRFNFLNKIKVLKNFSMINRILFLLFSLVLLILINFYAAWMVLGITMFILLIMAFWTRLFKERVNLLTLPIILLLISCFYCFGLPGKITFLNSFDQLLPLPQELLLDSGTARTIAWQSLKDYPVLGSTFT